MIYFSSAEQVIQDSIRKLKTQNKDKMDDRRDMAVSYYSFSNTGQYISDYFGGSLQEEIPLYPVNMTKRIIDRISLVYKNKPKRNIDNEKYPTLINKKNFQFKTFERLHNLLGTIAIKLSWDDRGYYRYRPLINFNPIFDPGDTTEPIAITYLLGKTKEDLYTNSQEDVFAYWSADEHFLFDTHGKITHRNENDENPYGRIPFVFVQPSTMIDEFWNEAGLDIAIANCQVDIAMTMLQHHIRSAGGQWVVEGRIDEEKLKLGLNKLLIVEDGTVKNLTQSVNINEIIEGIKFQLQQVAQNHHITFDFGLSGSKSGVALRMENIELLEARQDAVEIWRQVEREIYELERIFADVHLNMNLPEEMTIDYDEVDFPDAEQEMQEWEWKFKHGLADKIDWLMAKDPDGFPTRQDAEKYLKERKASETNIRTATNKEAAFKLNA